MTGQNPDKAGTPSKSWLRFGIGGAVLASCFAFLTFYTWQKWGDMLLDFGVELYIPWKLSTGAVLYRDIAYLTGGPVSQYFHASLFRIFGVSILSIAMANLALIAVFTGAVYWFFYKVTDAWAATTVGLALLLVFAFGHCTAAGIFNYVSPYSYELVHGVMVSVFILWLLARWWLDGGMRCAFLIGIGNGIVLLTKPEVILASGVTEAAAVFLAWKMRKGEIKILKSIAVIALGTIVVPGLFFVYFLQHENVAQSLRSVFWAIVALTRTNAPDNTFYRWSLGLTVPKYYLEQMAGWSGGLAGFIALYAGAFYLKIKSTERLALFLLLGIATVYLALNFTWGGCGYCLPLVCLASGVFTVRDMVRNRTATWHPFPFLWTAFSVLMLLKMGAYPRVWHYGFILAMPAFLTAVYFLVWQLPRLLEPCGVHAGYFRALASLGVLLVSDELWRDSKFAYDVHKIPVAAGGDRLWVMTPRYRSSSAALGNVTGWIESNTPPAATLSVLPEGAMVNYLTRRENPTGYLRWNPTEIGVYTEDKMLAAYTNDPPDYLVIVGSASEGTGKPFGENPSNDVRLKLWIDAHYHTNFQSTPPDALIYKRNH